MEFFHFIFPLAPLLSRGNAAAVLALPIARREMLVTARSAAFYRSRIAAGIVMLVCGTGFAMLYQRSGIGTLAGFLNIGTYSISMMTLFLGASLTSDAIARERREGTLGFLFLAGLSPFQITGGKLVAHCIAAFYTVLLLFPLLMLFVLTGGVAFQQILTVLLLALNTLFFSASLGIAASCTTDQAKKAAGRANAVLMIFWWGVPMAAGLAQNFKAPAWVAKALSFLSVGVFGSMWGPFRMGRPVLPPLWQTLLSTHLLGWCFLGLAIFLLPRIWQDRPSRARRSLREWWRDFSRGTLRQRARLRLKLLDRNPFLWLASRDRLRFAGVTIFTIFFGGLALWISTLRRELLLPLVLGLTFIHKLMMCGISSSQIGIEQEQGSLEMLLSTPLTEREILRGQYLAAVRRFRVAALLLFLLQLYAWHFTGTHSLLPASLLPVFMFVLAPSFIAAHFLDLHTAAWLGMWGAARASVAQAATRIAFGSLIIVPAMIFFSGVIALGLLNYFFGIRLPISFPVVMLIWLSLAVLNDFFWLRRTRALLPGALRLAAYRRYLPEPLNFWGKLGKALGTAFRRSRTALGKPGLAAQ
jgi:ABC-type transport system involved in multi-copper enzyme maturation permease subunit